MTTSPPTSLPYPLDRRVTIGARPETVFSFFTDTGRWASWWGAGSSIDAVPGGRVLIKYPNGAEASGEILEIVPPSRIVFTFGYAGNAQLGPGQSRVTIRLEPTPDGTRLDLRHEFADAALRDHHVQGWRYELSVFANALADLVHADAAAVVDRWLGAWAEPDATARHEVFRAIARPTIRFSDRFSRVDGIAELVPHVGAAQTFMPGLQMERAGDVRHCQGTVLANWTARTAAGEPRGAGTNVFVLDADGLIECVVGLWN